MPSLIDDWKNVLKRAWSVRLSALSALATTVIIAWPTAMLDIWNVLPDAVKALVPQNVALILPLALTLLAIWVRVLVQEKQDDDE